MHVRDPKKVQKTKDSLHQELLHAKKKNVNKKKCLPSINDETGDREKSVSPTRGIWHQHEKSLQP